MNPITILNGYFLWHYTSAFTDFLRVWGNFLWFVQHFFSIPSLFKTLFSPWKRLHEEYQKGLNSDFFGTLVVNAIMRIIGVIVRLIFIIIGTIFLIVVFLGGLLFFLFWIIMPFAIVTLFITGLGILI